MNSQKIVVALIACAVMGCCGAASAYSLINSTVVSPYDTDVYTHIFQAGEPVGIAVSGDGDSDLDLYIFDQNGNLITGDEDGTDTCLASWTPRWTGQFIIKVVNRGGLANAYTVAIR